MTDSKVFRLGELFCGPGGLAYGATTAAIEDSEYKIVHKWANDYDESTCQTYAHNICPDEPESVICHDVRTLDIDSLTPVDAFAFGFPCNDFSVVGEQKGFDGTFGPLYTYGVKVLKKFQPKWFLAENVGGLNSANEGNAFTKILSDLRDTGYRLYPHLYKFEEYGVPQARHRIIIVGIRNDLPFEFRPPSPAEYKNVDNSCRTALEKIPIPKDAFNNEQTKQSAIVVERLKHIKPGENAWTANLPDELKLNVKSARLSQIYKRLEPDKPAYTVTGSGGGGTHIYHYSEPRALTNRERARLQTFPDTYEFLGSKEQVRKQIGMAVPCDGARIIFKAILRTFAGIEYDSVPCNIDLQQKLNLNSMSVTENAAARKVWFVTRPQRDPLFHPEALKILDEVTEQFTLKWEGNRDLQKQYEVALNEKGLKRDHISDSGSGGRTWAAMLRTFSYVYLTDDGYLKPTKAGEEIIAGKNERENVTKLLLTLQIPNAYFLDSGFRPKYDDGFRIFPVRFLLKVLNHKDIGHYLTKEEIVYYVLPAKRNEDLDSVVQQILCTRMLTETEKSGIISDIEGTYEHRERSDSVSRTFYEANSDVAHTFMLLSEYAGGITYERGSGRLTITNEQSAHLSALLDEYDKKYQFRDAARYSSLDLLAQANGLSYNAFKITYSPGLKPACNTDKRIWKAQKILAELPNASELSYDDICNILSPVFTPNVAKKIAAEIDTSELISAEDEFAKRYLNETDNRQFEDDTGKLLSAIGFDVVMRPKPVIETKTNIEILAKYSSNEYCIFDAKNYSNVFQLSSGLRSLMHSEYIPNYDNYDGGTLTHYGYVTAGKFSGDRFLNDITEKSKLVIPDREIRGMIISANALLGYLEYCRIENVSKADRLNTFVEAIQNKGYSKYQEVLSAV